MDNINELEQYKSWFCNLSFFNYSSFILDSIEDLWSLINLLGKKYSLFCKYRLDKDISYSKVSLDEIITIVSEFFNVHRINIDIRDLINKEILFFEDSGKVKGDEFLLTKSDGVSYYDKNGFKKVKVVLNGTILDAFTLVHELMHYYNQPDRKRSFVNSMLTESISYGAELIFCESLKETVYENDRRLHFMLMERMLYNYYYKIYYIYKILYLFKKTGDIGEKVYNELFQDREYEETIKAFREFVCLKKSIMRDTRLIINLPLSIYFLEEFKKDDKFFDVILRFNDNINCESLSEAFSVLGFNYKSDLVNAIIKSSDSFISFLLSLYDNEREKKEI